MSNKARYDWTPESIAVIHLCRTRTLLTWSDIDAIWYRMFRITEQGFRFRQGYLQERYERKDKSGSFLRVMAPEQTQLEMERREGYMANIRRVAHELGIALGEVPDTTTRSAEQSVAAQVPPFAVGSGGTTQSASQGKAAASQNTENRNAEDQDGKDPAGGEDASEEFFSMPSTPIGDNGNLSYVSEGSSVPKMLMLHAANPAVYWKEGELYCDTHSSIDHPAIYEHLPALVAPDSELYNRGGKVYRAHFEHVNSNTEIVSETRDVMLCYHGECLECLRGTQGVQSSARHSGLPLAHACCVKDDPAGGHIFAPVKAPYMRREFPNRFSQHAAIMELRFSDGHTRDALVCCRNACETCMAVDQGRAPPTPYRRF